MYLDDPKYYSIGTRNERNLLHTKLYICHSGFYFSVKYGHCIPSFRHEYSLALASYTTGVDLAEAAGIKLNGKDMISKLADPSKKLFARMDIGANEILAAPSYIFGSIVPQAELEFEVQPCVSSGYFGTLDYRYFYSCLSKNLMGVEDEDSDEDSSSSESEDDENEEYAQVLYKCPPSFFYSPYYGFCVPSYVFDFIGSNHLEKYAWEGQRFKQSTGIKGLERPTEAVPWVAKCEADGRHSLKDPRYYFACANGAPSVFVCPSNMYFNAQTKICSTVIACNCWKEIGYVDNPYKGFSSKGGISIHIHLDRAYLGILRKIIGPVNWRTVVHGKSNGKDFALVTNLICFWREMEKYRTLQYPSSFPITQTK